MRLDHARVAEKPADLPRLRRDLSGQWDVAVVPEGDRDLPRVSIDAEEILLLGCGWDSGPPPYTRWHNRFISIGRSFIDISARSRKTWCCDDYCVVSMSFKYSTTACTSRK